MSGDAAALQCPVCFHYGSFDCADSMRNRLISVRAEAICPVCQEVFPGIEKLIEHLLSHIKLTHQNKIELHKKTTQNLNDNNELQQKRSRSTVSKNKTVTSSSANEPIKYVKIYPKLPTLPSNSVPVDENSKNQMGQSIKQESIPKSESETTCGLCGLQFIDTKILKMHLCLIHNIEDNSNITFTRYQCHVCPKNFKMRGSLMVHLRVAHYGFSKDTINKDSIMNKTSEVSETEKVLNTKHINSLKGDNKQWQCDVCKKFFTTKYFLKKHKRLHTGETPYACTQCNKTFTFQQSYHKHLLYHNDEKPHCCSFCGRAFKELSTLHNHQRIHTGEKPFSCETCGKSFRQRVSYLVHRRIHTGAMPYKCTACNKSFRYKVSQRTHKCQAQPPGTVIRQNVNLVDKLKRKHVSSNEMTSSSQPNNYLDVSDANAELALCGAKLSLEDTESENFNLLAEVYNNQETNLNKNQVGSISYDPNLEDLIDSIPIEETNVPSPSDILKKLCLSQDDYDDLTNIID